MITSVVTYFWVPHIKRRIYIYIYIYIYNNNNNSSKKRMPERPKNGQKLVEEVQKYKDENLTTYC